MNTCRVCGLPARILYCREHSVIMRKRRAVKNAAAWAKKNPERAKQSRILRASQPSAKLAKSKDGRERRRRIKADVIAAYGSKCSCCAEGRFEFLTIDHINGRLPQEKGDGHMGEKMYRSLQKWGYPKDRYRLLCMNCNFSLGKYGYCPHEKEMTQ